MCVEDHANGAKNPLRAVPQDIPKEKIERRRCGRRPARRAGLLGVSDGSACALIARAETQTVHGPADVREGACRWSPAAGRAYRPRYDYTTFP